jgi:hypothetical protein
MLQMRVPCASARMLGSGASARVASSDVDTLLVLAIDGSGSLSDERLTVQRAGHAAAVTSAAFLDAVARGPHGRVALAAVEWSNHDRQSLAVPWAVIRDTTTARAFAEALLRAPRPIPGFTSISGAIDFSVRLLAQSDYEATRHVIDVSGNGPNNDGRPVSAARAAAVSAGVTINGLPILDAVPSLDDYYAQEVVGGPGAFLVVAQSIDTYAQAIRRKLAIEVAATPFGRSASG